LRRADRTPADWLTYSGNYQAHRYSPLTQITRENVAQLKPAWIYQVRRTGIVETTPIVADGVMYITEPPSTVTALDVRTGRPLWTYSPTIPTDVIVIGSPPVNRGVAILDDMVLRRHRARPPDRARHQVRRGPLGHRGGRQQVRLLRHVGAAGARRPGSSSACRAPKRHRGILDAYDPKTGKRVWRTHTVPAPGEPGLETWSGDSWKTGGGSAWLTGLVRSRALTSSTGEPAIPGRLERRSAARRQHVHRAR
jgi:alcohol dehydrogenase (cytochrome c)